MFAKMENTSTKNSEINLLLNYYSTLTFQNTFLDYGITIISNYNNNKLQDNIVTLEALKEDLLENPENKILKVKFQIRLNQLRSVVLTQKRLQNLKMDIKKLTSR